MCLCVSALSLPASHWSSDNVPDLQAQLIDFVVESSEPYVLEGVQDHYELETSEDGLAEAWLPPGAVLSLHCLPTDTQTAEGLPLAFEAIEEQRQISVSHRSRQFVGFELQQTARLTIVLHEFGKPHAIEGAKIEVRVDRNNKC